MRRTGIALAFLGILALASCGAADGSGGADRPADGTGTAAVQNRDASQEMALPPGSEDAAAALDASPRHGEWADVAAGGGDTVRAWVVYPERDDTAPVVLVVHEIFGLTTWIRAVADRMAAEGFVAIAPDLLSGRDVPTGPGGDPEREAAVAAVRDLDPDAVHRRLAAVAEWGMNLPSATDSYGIVGFCWGGSTSFAHAARAPGLDAAGLDAAVVYYGSSPDSTALARVQVPVLGLYGGDDARVNATVPPADSVMAALGKAYETRFYEGAGHGFLRQREGREGANAAASRQAWPATIDWFRRHLGSEGP